MNPFGACFIIHVSVIDATVVSLDYDKSNCNKEIIKICTNDPQRPLLASRHVVKHTFCVQVEMGVILANI